VDDTDTQLALLRGDVSKSLWRELGAIVAKKKGEKSAQEGPPALTRRPVNRDTIVWVGSLVTTKDEGIVDCIEGRYPLPKEMFDEFGRAAYEKGVEFAVGQARRLAGLHGACSRYRFGLSHQLLSEEEFDSKVEQLPRGEKQHLRDWLASAQARFWTSVEQHLTTLFALARNPDLVADLPNSDWGKAVAEAARAAYEQSCPRQTPRQIEAYALGLRKLTDRPKPNTETKS
jgi:hypothetical protein